MTLTVVASATGSTGGSRSPVADWGGGACQTDDIVFLGVRVGTDGITGVKPSGWIDTLGNTVLTLVSVTGLTICGLIKVVTSGEAGATSFTATNLWDANQTNNQVTALLRGGSAASPIDVANSVSNSTASTTHVIAGLSNPARTGDLVVGFVTGAGTNTYTDPSGFTLLAKNAAAQGTRAMYKRDALTTAGVAVASQNITAGGSTRAAGITVAFSDPSVAQGANPGAFFALF